MILLTEKATVSERVKKAISQHVTEHDVFINLFGSGGILQVIPNDLPNTATDLETLIKNDLLDDAISFDTLNYFLAKAILGKNGDEFRKRLSDTCSRHNEIVAFVDAGTMHQVVEKLFTRSEFAHINKSIVPLTILTDTKLISDFENRTIRP